MNIIDLLSNVKRDKMTVSMAAHIVYTNEDLCLCFRNILHYKEYYDPIYIKDIYLKEINAIKKEFDILNNVNNT